MGVKGIKGIGVPKSFFKEVIMTLLASTPVFLKKKVN